MATVEIVYEKLQVLLTMGPNKEIIIDESHPDQWSVHRSLQQPLFQPTNKEISIGRSELPANCCPCFCLYFSPLNSKQLLLRTRDANPTRVSVATVELTLPSNASLIALRPSPWGVLGYSHTTSTVQRKAPSGMLPNLLSLTKRNRK